MNWQAMANVSAQRVVITTGGLVVLFLLKRVVEELFLRDDPEYADYLRRVRSRTLTGIP